MAAPWPCPVRPPSSLPTASVPCGAWGSRDPPLSAHIHLLSPCVPTPDSPLRRFQNTHRTFFCQSGVVRRGWLFLRSCPAIICPEYRPIHTSSQSPGQLAAPRMLGAAQIPVRRWWFPEKAPPQAKPQGCSLPAFFCTCSPFLEGEAAAAPSLISLQVPRLTSSLPPPLPSLRPHSR